MHSKHSHLGMHTLRPAQTSSFVGQMAFQPPVFGGADWISPWREPITPCDSGSAMTSCSSTGTDVAAGLKMGMALGATVSSTTGRAGATGWTGAFVTTTGFTPAIGFLVDGAFVGLDEARGFLVDGAFVGLDEARSMHAIFVQANMPLIQRHVLQ